MVQEMMAHLGIYGRERVIEEYDARSGVCRACKAEALPLSPREGGSALAHFRSVVSAFVPSHRCGQSSWRAMYLLESLFHSCDILLEPTGINDPF